MHSRSGRSLRRLTQLAAAGVLSLSLSTTSYSDDHAYNFDCDVPSGRGSAWSGPVYVTTPFELSGALTIPLTRYHRRWIPVGSLFLHGAGDRRVGIQFVVQPGDAENLQVVLNHEERETFATIPFPEDEQSIAFSLTLSSSGELTADVEGNSTTLQMGDFAVRRMAMSCSSGQFVFDNVTIETPVSSGDSA